MKKVNNVVNIVESYADNSLGPYGGVKWCAKRLDKMAFAKLVMNSPTKYHATYNNKDFFIIVGNKFGQLIVTGKDGTVEEMSSVMRQTIFDICHGKAIRV